jgi:NADH-quinone oxidoreductase E subunit
MAVINSDIKKEMDEIKDYFPTEQALLIPLLHAIQKRVGWISLDSMKEAAAYLHLPLGKVQEVVTFYTMFNQKPIGKKHVQICTNVSCWLNGSADLMNCMKKRYGIKRGETTKDGKFTLTEVECLASCGTAPVVQINEDYFEGLNVESFTKLLNQCEKEA